MDEFPPGYTAENVANKSTDVTLGGASPSDILYPSQKAAKAYADAVIGAQDAMIFKGVINCSANPNYPAADRGATYRVSVAGKIGGASGINVEAGDLIICLTDGTVSSDQATVGTAWTIAQTNLDGAVIGPASAVGDHVVFFDSTTGKLIKDSGVTLGGSNTGDQTLTSLGAAPAALNPGLANLAYNGVFFTATAGENVAIGDVCYLKSDGKYWLAKADVATTKMPGVVMATGTISANATGIFLQKGFLRYDSWSGWAVGGALYVTITGTTSNTVSQTAPSATGNIVQDIGYAYAAKVIFFDPNRTQVEVP